MLRGLAILLVVVGHSIQWTDAGFDANPLFSFIYSFHMPLFFFISGVVGARGIRRPLLDQLRAKTLTLLVPFASWWLLVSVVQWLDDGQSPPAALLSLVKSPDVGLWFLWVLFVITLSSAVSLRLAPKRAEWAGLIGMAVLLQVARVPVLGVTMVSWYFPFFAGGLLLSDRFIRGTALDPKKRRPAELFAIVIWFGLALGWHRESLVWPAQEWAARGGPMPRLVDMPYRYVTAAASIATACVVVRRIAATSWAGKALGYFGRNTLEVYVSHGLFLTLFAGTGALCAPVAAAAALSGSLALATALKRIPLLRITLYGGRR